LAAAGLGVAVFHEYLELAGKLECPAGIMGIGTAPQQSFAVLAILLAFITVGVVRSWKVSAAGPALLLGLLLAWGAVASSPPMPPEPAQPYTAPLDVCRPPFHRQ
jgi:hypothetical protein